MNKNIERVADPSNKSSRPEKYNKHPSRPGKPSEPRGDQGSGFANTPGNADKNATQLTDGTHAKPVTNQDEQRRITNVNGSEMNEEETEGDLRHRYAAPAFEYAGFLRNSPR